MNTETMSSKDLQWSICCMENQARLLLNKGKDYDTTLLEILNFNKIPKFSMASIPNSKQTYKLLRIKPEKFKKQLGQIYNDILEMADENPKPFTFTDVVYEFYFKDGEKSISISGNIPVRPMVGEGFSLPFFKATFGGSFGTNDFYVNSIDHALVDCKQYIQVELVAGRFNSYEKFKKDKDEFEKHERWVQRLKE